MVSGFFPYPVGGRAGLVLDGGGGGDVCGGALQGREGGREGGRANAIVSLENKWVVFRVSPHADRRGEPALFLTVEAVETFVGEHNKVGREGGR